MRLRVYSTAESQVTIDQLPDSDALDLVNDLQDPGGSQFLVLELDGESTTYLARQHIVRVDLDPDKSE